MAPSAARVAGITSAGCTRVSTGSNDILWVEWNHGEDSRISNSLLTIAKVRNIHGAAGAKIGYSSISAFATRPGRHLTGWVDWF